MKGNKELETETKAANTDKKETTISKKSFNYEKQKRENQRKGMRNADP